MSAFSPIARLATLLGMAMTVLASEPSVGAEDPGGAAKQRQHPVAPAEKRPDKKTAPPVAGDVKAPRKPDEPTPGAAAKPHAVVPPKAAKIPDNVPAGSGVSDAAFRTFLEALWPEAQAQGISRETFDAAFDGVAPDPTVVALTKKQAEFVKPIWTYLADAVSPARIERGRRLAEQWRDVLAQLRASYGVPPEIVLSIWGMETNFGAFYGDKNVVRSIATLAFIGHRGTVFKDELLAALRILQERNLPVSVLRGSWAGAMGQPQFMPSSYLKFAVSYKRQGPGDIWNSVPDSLASIANYLKSHEWRSDLPWGVEVRIPEGFDYRTMRQGFPGWSALGFRRIDGKPLPSHGEATLFLLAGAQGPAFLITDNFAVIKQYNSSDAYALAVAQLGEQIAGRPGIRGEWPVNEKQLSKSERESVQKLLAALGHYDGPIDGRLGSGTRTAVQSFQIRAGLVPADGYATPALLKKLQEAAAPATPQ